MRRLRYCETPELLLELFGTEAPSPVPIFSLRRTLFVAVGLLASIALLAAVVPIGGAVIGGGQVGVASRVKRIAHPIGGVITAIAVHNGQRVKTGELLMRLDSDVSGAAAAYSVLTVEQLLAQKARLEAERMNAARIIFPDELLNANATGAEQAMVEEKRLFALRRTELSQMSHQLRARLTQYTESIRGIEAQIKSLEVQRRLIQPELEGVRNLWQRNLVTINRLNQLERTAVDLDGSVGAQRSQIAQTRARMSETREQIIQLETGHRSEAATELGKINTALNEQRLRNVAASYELDRSDIRAPDSGTIEKLAFSAVGEVVRPVEPIMEIVPDQDEMLVEAAISPNDIDQIRAGQKARIRFSSFNRAVTPEIAGTVTYVANDRSDLAKTGEAIYVARVRIDQAAVHQAGLVLRSGMPAEVYIETGSRSLLSYVTKPLRDQINRSFRGD